MAKAETFRGYGPEPGYEFLIALIAKHDYGARGVSIAPDEIIVSDGSKSDSGNIQEIFAADAMVALTDPVYPVYLDSNVMAGRTGPVDERGRYAAVVYLPCTAENGFEPPLPSVRWTWSISASRTSHRRVLKKPTLKKWVDWARQTAPCLLYDAAYEAYIRDPAVPHSIYEVEGAREVAIEFRSFSKSAGFTGTRCAFTVVPKEVTGRTAGGERVGAERPLAAAPVDQVQQRTVHHPEGRRRRLHRGGPGAGARAGGQLHGERAHHPAPACRPPASPSTAARTRRTSAQDPPGRSSWDFFDTLLNEAHVVGTPGPASAHPAKATSASPPSAPRQTEEAIFPHQDPPLTLAAHGRAAGQGQGVRRPRAARRRSVRRLHTSRRRLPALGVETVGGPLLPARRAP